MATSTGSLRAARQRRSLQSEYAFEIRQKDYGNALLPKLRIPAWNPLNRSLVRPEDYVSTSDMNH